MSHTSGIVLSGGGANGAYEIGVLKALLRGESPATDRQPLEPAVIAATSISAFNSATLLSNYTDSWSHAVGALEKVWLERVSLAGRGSRNGVFRLRANPLTWMDVGLLRSVLSGRRGIWPQTRYSWRRTGRPARASSRRRRAASNGARRSCSI